MLDAPVSGGAVGADNATLTFMCGGAKVAFDRAQIVLEGMGKASSIAVGEVRGRLGRSVTIW